MATTSLKKRFFGGMSFSVLASYRKISVIMYSLPLSIGKFASVHQGPVRPVGIDFPILTSGLYIIPYI